MKVIVVTQLTPTPENRGGTSALLYALLRYRPSDVEVTILSYNFNRISCEEIREISALLNAKIDLLEIPRVFLRFRRSVWLTRYQKYFGRKSMAKRLITKELVEDLRNEDCDFVLLYPGSMVALAFYLPEKSFVYSSPDCSLMNLARRFYNPYRMSSKKIIRDDFISMTKENRAERRWDLDNMRVHFVGMADNKYYRDVTGNTNSHFLLHPFVKYKEKKIDFISNEKLKVIIPGSYDMYYNTDVDKMIPSLIKCKDILLRHFDFTFLGKKWSPVDQRLKDAGFNCEFKTWVDDYAEELVQHDIQITPISFGTGTKGKVLDAMVNGLLVIGSDYALENICVRDMDSCVRYRDASHIASILISVANHRERYQAIAEKGRSQVLKYHDPTRISKRFFDIYYRELCGKNQ